VPRRLVTLVLLLLALVSGLGCGGDDEPSRTATAPELTVPDTDTEQTDTTDTQPSQSAPPSGEEGQGGGTPSPPSEGQKDTPENDLPPAPGTPEDRFEKFCRENPGACG
jgi:hypothetical protein